MGGVVSDIGSGLSDAISGVGSGVMDNFQNLGLSGGGGGILGEISKAGQGIVSGVDKGLTQLDDAIPQEAKIAAAIYLATQGVPTGAEGGALANLGATDMSLGMAGAANAGAASSALGAATYDQVLSQLTQYPTTIAPEVLSTAGEMTAQETLAKIAAEQGGGGVLSSALNWASANPLQAAGLGLAASKALGGGTSPTGTSTSSVDPDVKAAYLRNLEEARATAAGLGPKQFAAFPEYNLGMVQKYMNPYEQQVIQGTLGDIERARQGQISAEGAAATAAKAFGGSRQGVTRSLVDEAALRNATNAVAQLRQGGFTQAQNLGLSQEALRQQYEQSKLDAARNLGLERLGVSQGALSLQPSGGTQSAPLYKNTTASALGGALGGAQLGSIIGGTANPEYAGYGAAAGGLLGFL